jgi:hypothetical protein
VRSSPAARALAWVLPCVAAALASAAETTGRRRETAAGSDPVAAAEAARLLPFDGRVRLARALGEGYERGLGSPATSEALAEALHRRPRHPETLLAAGQDAAARGDPDAARRLSEAAVRASWHDASVAMTAGRSRIEEAREAARRAVLAQRRAVTAEEAGDAAGAAAAREEAARLLDVARTALRDVGRIAALLSRRAHGGASMKDVEREAEETLAEIEGLE